MNQFRQYDPRKDKKAIHSAAKPQIYKSVIDGTGCVTLEMTAFYDLV